MVRWTTQDKPGGLADTRDKRSLRPKEPRMPTLLPPSPEPEIAPHTAVDYHHAEGFTTPAPPV